MLARPRLFSSRRALLFLALTVLLTCYPAVTRAQYGPPAGSSSGDAFEAADKKKKKEKKRKRGWHLFVHPAKADPVAQLAYADGLRARQPKKALKQYRALVLRWPEAPEAAPAQRAYAELLQARGKLYKAGDEYRYLLDHYAGQFDGYEEVLGRLFDIAKELIEKRKGRFLFLPGFKAPERATPALETIVQNGPHWEGAAEAQYLLGWIHEFNDEYEDAVYAYEVGLQRYPGTPFAERCAYGRAYCLFLLSEESPYSIEAAREARAAMVLFARSHPRSENAPLAQEYADALLRRMAKDSYDMAVFYDRIARKPKAALVAYEEFAKNFPSSEWTSVAEIRIDALRRVMQAQAEEARDENEADSSAARVGQAEERNEEY